MAIKDFLDKAKVPFIIGLSLLLLKEFVLKEGVLTTPLLLLGVLILFVFWFIYEVIVPYFSAYRRLIYTANFRGYWKDGSLKKEVTKNYRKSNSVKIKVTRGYKLFNVEDGVFNKLIYGPSNNDKKNIKVLLHYPCLKSRHVKNRATANQISIEDYIKDLFEVLKKFKLHNQDVNQDETISVRFYMTNSNDYRDWRFYIFEDKSEGKNILFFNHYNDETPGAKSNMLKVRSGVNSLCNDLNLAFDDIFDDDSTELLSNEANSIKLVNNNFCKHPGCKEAIEKVYKGMFKH